METVQARAQVIQFRPLVTKSKEERQLEVALYRCECLQRRNPNYFTGRQLFLQELNGQVEMFRGSGRIVEDNVDKQIMRLHGGRWHAMTHERRADYEARAQTKREVAWDDLHAARSENMHEMSALRLKIEQAKSLDNPLRMSACRLAPGEWAEFVQAYQAPEYSKIKVVELRAARASPIGPPAAQVQAVLESIEVPEVVKAPNPPWVRLLTYHRDFFKTCAFRVADPTVLQILLGCATAVPCWLRGVEGRRCAINRCFGRVSGFGLGSAEHAAFKVYRRRR
jgi:hypothetical protein